MPLLSRLPCGKTQIRCSNCKYYGNKNTPSYFWLKVLHKISGVKPQLITCQLTKKKLPYYYVGCSEFCRKGKHE